MMKKNCVYELVSGKCVKKKGRNMGEDFKWEVDVNKYFRNNELRNGTKVKAEYQFQNQYIQVKEINVRCNYRKDTCGWLWWWWKT